MEKDGLTLRIPTQKEMRNANMNDGGKHRKHRKGSQERASARARDSLSGRWRSGLRIQVNKSALLGVECVFSVAARVQETRGACNSAVFPSRRRRECETKSQSKEA